MPSLRPAGQTWDVAARNIEAAYPADGAGSRSAGGHDNRTDRLPVVVLDVAEE